MATSGSIDFNRDRNQIVTDALLLAGIIEAGEPPAAEEMEYGAAALNKMVKAWQGKGLHLWTKADATLFFVRGQARYAIGAAGDHAAIDPVKTELSVAAVATDPTVTVDSATGIANADNIGIELDDLTLHWTTVSGAPAGDVITLAVAMPSAAAVDGHVYAYTKRLDRPLRCMDYQRLDDADQDIPIISFSREEYFDTPNKTTIAKTTEVYYDAQLDLGQMYLWPTPDTVRDRLKFTAILPLEDFDAATDNPHFPQEWLEAIEFNLAVRLAPAFGVPMEERAWLKAEAREKEEDARMWDTEPESIYFAPDLTVGGWG